MQSVSAAGLAGYWVDVITWVFVVANTGRLLAYLPQFISAWKCPHGAKSVSILTWSYFTFAHCTALLYALLVLHDSKSVWIFAGNLAVTTCLVTLLLWKRLTFLSALRRSFEDADSKAANGTERSKSIEAWAASNEDNFDISMTTT